MTLQSKIKGVVALIQMKNTLLAVKRSTEIGNGSWSLPGGKVESGETEHDALIREVKEETGYDVKIINNKPIFFGKIKYGGLPATFSIYESEIIGGSEKMAIGEVSDIAWISGEEYISSLIENKFLPEVVGKLKKMLTKESLYGI